MRSRVMLPIPGTSKRVGLREDMAAVSSELSAEELDAISPVDS